MHDKGAIGLERVALAILRALETNDIVLRGSGPFNPQAWDLTQSLPLWHIHLGLQELLPTVKCGFNT